MTVLEFFIDLVICFVLCVGAFLLLFLLVVKLTEWELRKKGVSYDQYTKIIEQMAKDIEQ
jgi:hypothetical protein